MTLQKKEAARFRDFSLNVEKRPEKRREEV
jgi:hypothetical protein